MKKLLVLLILSVMALMYTGCAQSSYTNTKPAYEDVVKPQRPDSLHFWVDGDWIRNKGAKDSVCTEGYWTLPIKGRTFQAGHWKTTRRGAHWVAGRWVGHVI